MIQIEEFHEFAARHETTDKRINDGNGRLLFVTGAQCDARFGTERVEPPSSEAQLTKAVLGYWRARLAGATEKFKSSRAVFHQQAMAVRGGTGPGPAPGWQDTLKALTDESFVCQMTIDELEEPARAAREAIMAQERERVALGENLAAEIGHYRLPTERSPEAIRLMYAAVRPTLAPAHRKRMDRWVERNCPATDDTDLEYEDAIEEMARSIDD